MKRRRTVLIAGLTVAGLGSLWFVGLRHYSDPSGVFGVFPSGPFALLVGATLLSIGAAFVAAGESRPARRQRAIRVGAALIALIVGVALLEVPAALGLVDYRRVLAVPDAYIRPLQFDSKLLDVHEPNGRFVGEVTGDLAYAYGVNTRRSYPVDVRYDSRGFRNHTAVEEADIVVIGDSFAEADLVPFEAIIASRLSGSLGRPALNLGHNGFGPPQELATLERYGFAARPKVVVWLMFEGNDLRECAQYEQNVANSQSTAPALSHPLVRRSFSRNLLAKLAQLTNDYSRRRSARLLGPGEAHGETMYFAYECKPLSARDLSALESTQRIIGAAFRGCTERASAFLLVYVPVKYRVYSRLIDSPGPEVAQWELHDLPQRLESWSKASGIPYLDLTPALSSAANAGELVFFLDDSHWNSNGNKAAAEAIAAFIRCQGWLAVSRDDGPGP